MTAGRAPARASLAFASLLCGAALAFGCGGGPAASVQRAEARANAGGSPIERVELAERPALTLVARAGDPRGAVAFVAAHSRGAALSLGLLSVLRARLEARGIGAFEARAHGLGFEIAQAVSDETEVTRFVKAVRAALSEAVHTSDPALARAQREVEALRALTFAGPGEASVSACSGELGFERNEKALDLASAEGANALEATRVAVFRAHAAAFAALGSTAVLDSATRAVGGDSAWPAGDPDDDAWPEADALFVDNGNGPRRLSMALRASNIEAVLGAGLALGSTNSPLSERLEALSPPWRIERASAVARLRGACLRIDLAAPKGDPAPSAEEIARAAAVTELSVQELLDQAEPFALDESVLRPSHPLRAAGVAAWRALLHDAGDAKSRSVIAFLAEPRDSVAVAEIEKALTLLRTRRAHPSLDVSFRPEAGQGELWMLLASPCGTSAEATNDAGASSLALRAIALRGAAEDVQLEPWVTSDGVGLLAHAPRRDARESALEQADRVAAVLGRAIGRRLGGAEVGAARTQLLSELGGRPFAGWSALLDGLAPGHASWLEPRGSWASVSELSTDELERTRRYLLAGPLRLSVLANRGEAQAANAARTLESWLLPVRGNMAQCAALRAEPPRHGESRLLQNGGALEGAYVGVVLAESGAAGARAAELAELLLNQPNGLLQRALTPRAAGASATARALGGFRRPSLVVEIRAMPEQLGEAIAAVRVALDELGRGQLRPEDVSQASARLAERDAEAHFDPRRRIVDLFRGAGPAKIEIPSIKTALSSFTQSLHWTVSVARNP